MMVNVRTYDAPPVCEKEILRYAGCREADPGILESMRNCLEEAKNVMTYRVCWQETKHAAYGSQSLQKNLAGCEKVIVFAATVGVGLDRLLAKYSRVSPAKALMLQAIGAERIEALCDNFCQEIQRETGLFARPRFSPGYADLPLTVQRDIFSSLNCQKHLGLYLNESLLMTPSKSVTAFVGLSRDETKKTANKCTACGKTDCAFRGAI